MSLKFAAYLTIDAATDVLDLIRTPALGPNLESFQFKFRPFDLAYQETLSVIGYVSQTNKVRSTKHTVLTHKHISHTIVVTLYGSAANS